MVAASASAEVLSPQRSVQDALASYYGLRQYVALRRFVEDATSCVFADREFQRAFNALYHVRRSASWQAAFYGIFQEARTTREIGFPTLLHEVYEKTGRVEVSFVSKMLAMLDDDQPIWDSRVVRLLNASGYTHLAIPSHYANYAARLQAAEQSYADLQKFYHQFLASDEGGAFIAQFDALLPRYVHISATKKADCLLWGSEALEREPQI